MIKAQTRSLERILKRFTPAAFKKFALFFMVNPLTGRAVKALGIKKNLFGGYFDYATVTDTEAARIFWGVWESAEIRFSKRFATAPTIVELGSSVGVTLGVLATQRRNTRFVCIEASPSNFKKLERLKSGLPQGGNDYTLVNRAIAYGVDSINFAHTSTTGSRIDDTAPATGAQRVPAATLTALLREFDISGDYTLITDIEGAEAAIFFQDRAALTTCSQIVAELENTSAHSIEDQITALKDVGFRLTERYGNVIAMAR